MTAPVTTPERGREEALRHKLIADIFDLPVWYLGDRRVVTPRGWHALTVEERDLLADALKQWKRQ